MPIHLDSEFEKKTEAVDIKEKVKEKQKQQKIATLAKDTEFEKQKRIQQELLRIKPQKQARDSGPSISDIKKNIEISNLIEGERQKEIDKILSSEELNDLKKATMNVLAMPHTDPIKRQIFSNRLGQSEVVNNFINDNIMYKFFNYANSNIKFAFVYGINFVETNNDYNKLILASQIQQKKEQYKREEETLNKMPEVAELKTILETQ